MVKQEGHIEDTIDVQQTRMFNKQASTDAKVETFFGTGYYKFPLITKMFSMDPLHNCPVFHYQMSGNNILLWLHYRCMY